MDGGEDRVEPRVLATAVGCGALATGSLAVGATAPWLAGALAVGAVVVLRLARAR